MYVPNTCLIKIGSAEGWEHLTRLIVVEDNNVDKMCVRE
jgi:hypothetical protein